MRKIPGTAACPAPPAGTDIVETGERPDSESGCVYRELYANVGARRCCEFRSTAQSEIDRSDGVCGTSFGMSASPIGRKKIAHRFIGGSWCENRMSPVRDDRAGLWCLTFSFAPPDLRGSGLFSPVTHG